MPSPASTREAEQMRRDSAHAGCMHQGATVRGRPRHAACGSTRTARSWPTAVHRWSPATSCTALATSHAVRRRTCVRARAPGLGVELAEPNLLEHVGGVPLRRDDAQGVVARASAATRAVSWSAPGIRRPLPACAAWRQPRGPAATFNELSGGGAAACRASCASIVSSGQAETCGPNFTGG